MLQYQAEQWRSDECARSPGRSLFAQPQLNPSAGDQTRLLHLLGLINYQILKGNRVYIEVDGLIYKTIYGAYWRSVFTGVEHYLLKCEEISGWSQCSSSHIVDVPIAYADGGWTAGGCSLSLICYETATSKRSF